MLVSALATGTSIRVVISKRLHAPGKGAKSSAKTAHGGHSVKANPVEMSIPVCMKSRLLSMIVITLHGRQPFLVVNPQLGGASLKVANAARMTKAASM